MGSAAVASSNRPSIRPWTPCRSPPDWADWASRAARAAVPEETHRWSSTLREVFVKEGTLWGTVKDIVRSGAPLRRGGRGGTGRSGGGLA